MHNLIASIILTNSIITVIITMNTAIGILTITIVLVASVSILISSITTVICFLTVITERTCQGLSSGRLSLAARAAGRLLPAASLESFWGFPRIRV